MEKSNEEIVEEALIKKAIGYDAREVLEEFTIDEEQKKEILLKKKVSIKHYPPDVSAIKILLNYYGNKTFDELENLSTTDLIKERDKLLMELKTAENKE